MMMVKNIFFGGGGGGERVSLMDLMRLTSGLLAGLRGWQETREPDCVCESPFTLWDSGEYVDPAFGNAFTRLYRSNRLLYTRLHAGYSDLRLAGPPSRNPSGSLCRPHWTMTSWGWTADSSGKGNLQVLRDLLSIHTHLCGILEFDTGTSTKK